MLALLFWLIENCCYVVLCFCLFILLAEFCRTFFYILLKFCMEIIHVAISDFLSNLIHFKFGVDQEIFGMIYAYFVNKYIKPFADLFVEILPR